MQKTQCD